MCICDIFFLMILPASKVGMYKDGKYFCVTMPYMNYSDQ